MNFDKNKIVPVTKYSVDGHEFYSEADAEGYIKKRDEGKSILEKNEALLDSLNQFFIPVWDEEQKTFDIFVKDTVDNYGNYLIWQSLVDGKEIRYYDTPLQVITPDKFMNKFSEHPTIHIDNNNFNRFVAGVIQINERCKNPLDWRAVIELISNVQVTPVYIYS